MPSGVSIIYEHGIFSVFRPFCVSTCHLNDFVHEQNSLCLILEALLEIYPVFKAYASLALCSLSVEFWPLVSEPA